MKVSLMVLPNPILSSPDAHFPVGILYVGAIINSLGHDVNVIDLRKRKTILDSDIDDKIDILCITATSGEINWMNTAAQIARSKGIITVIGGAHSTFCPDMCEAFDHVVIGDGELVISHILYWVLTNPQSRDDVRVRKYKQLRWSKQLFSIVNLQPDWSLIGDSGFSRELFAGDGYDVHDNQKAAGIISSRGCAFACSYCRSARDKIRFRSVNDVVSEIVNVKENYGVDHFRFYDECMTADNTKSLALFNCFSRMNIHWRAHTRSNYAIWNDKIAYAAKIGGCTEMGFGFECASDDVLRIVRKQESVDDHRSAVRVSHRNGILCKAFWMVGLPGEKQKHIDDIKRFMTDEHPDKWIVSIFAPYPGSDVYMNPAKYNVHWMEKDLSKYWNFTGNVVAYADNHADEIMHQYYDLIEWLQENFPHERHEAVDHTSARTIG